MANARISEKIPEPEYPEEEEEAPVYTEQQLGQIILKVASRIGREKTSEGKWKDTKYHEILTSDVTSANLDEGSLSVLRNLEELLAMIKSFGDTYTIDMSEAYNFISDYHNALVVSSKASEGWGARTAKSQYVEEKLRAKYYDERRNQSRLEKTLGGLLKKGGDEF